MGNNKLFLIAGGLVIVSIVLIAVVLLSRGFGPGDAGEPADLQFWGVFDDSGAFRQSIDAFRASHPEVTVNYRQFTFEDYEKSLVNAFASGVGPDIFMIQNTWLPSYQDKIMPLPQQIPERDTPLLTLKEFREQFVDVAEKDLVVGGEIYGLPLYVDTLALYYNKDIFNSLGISQPPQTWNDFNEFVENVTVADLRNNISRAGAAIGTARNINRSTDILSLLMLQSGVPMVDSDQAGAEFSNTVNGRDLGEVALEYYTDFANPAKRVYTWNDGLHYSIDAFQEGNVAMMFNYSHQMPLLRSKAPRLNFAVAPMPQLDSGQLLNYANYWAPTVSKFSKSGQQAWEFLVFLSSTEGVIPYLNSTGRPTARRDLVDQQKSDLDLGVFAKQVLSAVSWYQVDALAIESVMADMIDDVNFGRRSISEALRTAENKINVLMQRR
ncbi:MAG: extracellular solute-binding protein [Candidatus Yanofskybacteria bacterium]|nr:extracellular solute-binding protein [Candidatus Yanofskybacteria bacterium]